MTDNVTVRVKRSRAEWAAIIEAQERSGESAARFCRVQAICYKQFLYRHKTLKKSGRSLATTGPSRDVSVSGRFTPVQMEENASVRFRFPMGLVLESDRIPSAAWVVEVARRWSDGEGSPC